MTREKPNLLARFFIPRYDELALFLMSLAFVLLFCSDADLRAGSRSLVFDDFDLRALIGLVVFVVGIVFSLHHVFTTREKTDWEKSAMLFFAVVVNGVSGIAAGMHLWDRSEGWLIVFPAWNIASGIVLLVMYRWDIINNSSIVDDDATPLQVFVGGTVVMTAFAVCHIVFEMYWAITFSICVAYASNVNGAVQNLLFGRPGTPSGTR